MLRYLLLLGCLLVPASLPAQPANAFSAAEDAAQLARSMRPDALHEFAERRIADRSLRTAADSLLTAEILKRLGDRRAADYYEEAIRAAPDDAAYELFFADYLRNFRGPRRPLFDDAARHYGEAVRKLVRSPDSGIVADRVDRGIVALYQKDGTPLYWDGEGKPLLFLASVQRLARSTADLDEVHDTRDFTSEAAFSSSAARLNRPLTSDELRALVRLKKPFATYARLRLRFEELPVLDVFYQGRRIESAQITNFYEPGRFNDVELQSFGIAVEKTFATMTPFDVYLRTGYSVARRTGVVEFLPKTHEDIDQFDARVAVARFIGPDKLNIETSYARQDIVPDGIDSPARHDRHLAAVTFDYQFLRALPFLESAYTRRFSARGLHFLGGVAVDLERFGPVDVTRRDYFTGLSVNGLGPVDVSVQPGIIDARVSGDRRQTHSHFRTDVNLLIRLLDEERQPGIPRRSFLGLRPAFIHLAFPFKKDVALHGLNAFENYRIGAALSVKLFRRAFTEGDARLRPATILATVRYDRQWFSRLDETVGQFGISIGVGY